MYQINQMYPENWAWSLNALMALSHFVQHGISALSDHFFIFLFHLFKDFFLCHEQSTLPIHKGIAQIPSSSLFLISFVWMFYSTPSHSGERGAMWRLLLSTPAGPGSAMISPILLCSQLATLRNGQASSTRMQATLIPTNLTPQLLLPRFCSDIILCTEGIRN